jgi:hypothetical protein
MRLHTKTTQFILAAFLFCATFAGFGQDQTASQPKPDSFLGGTGSNPVALTRELSSIISKPLCSIAAGQKPK